MDKGLVLLVAAVVAIAGVTVGAFVNEKDEPGWPEDDAVYEEKVLTAFMFGTDEKDRGSITLRYYEDTPNIAYVSVTDYYRLIQKAEMTVEYMGNGVYKLDNLKSPNAGEARIDVRSGTFSTDDYRLFAYISDVNAPSSSGSGTLVPFIKAANPEEIEAPSKTTMDLAKYGIAIHTDSDDGSIWMPFQTVADMFINVANYYAELVDDAVFFMDVRAVMEKSLYLNDPEYRSRLVNSISPGKVRPADLAESSYNELCFLFDNFYGKPGIGLISDLQAEYGLDKALEMYDDSTRLIRTYMKSADYAEYLAAVNCLGYYLYDGGHTVTALGVGAFVSRIMPDTSQEWVDFHNDIVDAIGAISPQMPPNKEALMGVLSELRQNSWGEIQDLGGGSYYYAEGDTAVYIFNEFNLDMAGWATYYSDGGEYPTDCIGGLRSALEIADADPEIRNFVIDLTTNTGGYVLDVMYINSLLTGLDSQSMSIDVQARSVTQEIYQADTNLDGVFDEQDHQKQYDFDFGFLTSACSFSSGNMMPVLAQRSGIMILGERSGGGSCSLEVAAISEGIPITISSSNKTVVGYGEEGFDENTVEFGAYPDAVLTQDSQDISEYYAHLYDLALISERMSEFYSVV